MASGLKKLQNYHWKRSTFRSSSIWTRLELTSVLHFFWIYRLKMRVRSGMDIILYCNNEFFFTKMAMKVELSTWECQSANWRERWERKQTRGKTAPSKEKVSLENFIKNFWLLLNILQALRKNTKEAPQTMAARRIVKKRLPLNCNETNKNSKPVERWRNLAKFKMNSFGRFVTNRRYFWCEKKENREY